MVLRLPEWVDIKDIFRDGRALVQVQTLRSTMRGVRPGETRERDLSWHETSFAKDMTPDGKTLVFDEGAEGAFHALYVRPMDGSPAKRIGEGRALAISPDGLWVAANAKGRGSPIVLLPTGAGESVALESAGHRFDEAAFFPDGKRLLLIEVDQGKGPRSYVLDLPSGKPRPIADQGVLCRAVSPDGRQAACTGPGEEGLIVPSDGGPTRSIRGFPAENRSPMGWAAAPLTWSSDSGDFFVGQQGLKDVPARPDSRSFGSTWLRGSGRSGTNSRHWPTPEWWRTSTT